MNNTTYDPFSSQPGEELPTQPGLVPVEDFEYNYNTLDSLRTALKKQGGDLIVIPKGAKGIVVMKEFSPQLKSQIEALEHELKSIKAINSDEAAVKANATLAKAKKLITAIENDRKLMTNVLDEEKKDTMNHEKAIVSILSNLVTIVNKSITDYKIEEDRKARERQAEIDRQKAEELAKIRDEENRKAKIRGLVINLENNILGAIQKATLSDIDSKIKTLETLTLDPNQYQEFIYEAIDKVNIGLTRAKIRKTELTQLAELEAKNKEAADKMKQEQAERDAKAQQEAAERQKETERQAKEEKQSAIANVQMGAEFESATMKKPESVQKRWTFEEETIDLAKLPLEYHTFDAAKIKKAISEGARKIEGVNIYQKIVNVAK
jgi:DNA repair exonuclease SbcCD ATPase subunit